MTADDRARDFLAAILHPKPEGTGLFKRFTERPPFILPGFMQQPDEQEETE